MPDVEAQVVPPAAARVAAAALPSEAEGPPAVQSVPGAAVVLVGRPQLVSAVALPAEAQLGAGLIAAPARGFESAVAAARPQGRASASRPAQ